MVGRSELFLERKIILNAVKKFEKKSIYSGSLLFIKLDFKVIF